MFTCNDEKIYKMAKSLMSHGIGTTTLERNNKIAWYREAISSGHNFRMSNIHAAIGHAQFNRLEEMNNNEKSLLTFIIIYFLIKIAVLPFLKLEIIENMFIKCTQ